MLPYCKSPAAVDGCYNSIICQAAVDLQQLMSVLPADTSARRRQLASVATLAASSSGPFTGHTYCVS